MKTIVKQHLRKGKIVKSHKRDCGGKTKGYIKKQFNKTKGYLDKDGKKTFDIKKAKKTLDGKNMEVVDKFSKMNKSGFNKRKPKIKSSIKTPFVKKRKKPVTKDGKAPRRNLG